MLLKRCKILTLFPLNIDIQISISDNQIDRWIERQKYLVHGFQKDAKFRLISTTLCNLLEYPTEKDYTFQNHVSMKSNYITLPNKNEIYQNFPNKNYFVLVFILRPKDNTLDIQNPSHFKSFKRDLNMVLLQTTFLFLSMIFVQSTKIILQLLFNLQT